jgi:predicted metalloprotease with PDZ domain
MNFFIIGSVQLSLTSLKKWNTGSAKVSQITSLRSGILSLEDFIAKINEDVIEPHYNSTLKTKPNGEINAENFWSDMEWEKLPNRRGLIYAFYLDTKIKQQEEDNRSLDNFMRDILYNTTTNKVKFNRHVFLEVLHGYKLDDYVMDYENFIEQGNPIDLSKLNIIGIYFEAGKVPFMHIQEMEASDKIARFLMR